MLNYALIGCGRISPNHIAAALSNRLNIRALCDVLPEAASKAAQLHNLEDLHFYEDYQEMLSKEKLDLVAIATESGNHAALVMDCLRAGVHVIVEKPIALSLADADAMAELAKSKQLILCPCHQNRFNKSILKIREAIDQNRFGKLLHAAAHIRWSRGKAYYEQAPWRGTWAQDGGALMNQCIHNIDLLRWMMGDEIEEVFAYTDQLMHPYIEAEDLGLALVKFKNGAYGLIEGTTNIFPSNLEETLYLFGSAGTVKAGGKSVNIIEEWRFEDGIDHPEDVKANSSEEPPNIYGFGHTPLYADVIDSIINERDPFITAEAGRRAVELVLAIYLSASLGRPVKFPLEPISTVDFAGLYTD
ncbi:MAG: Gfo/Idh/MocA family oxidoreductase [Saccharofermentanales bacterium]